MLLKRNLLESLTILSCSGTVICVLLNYVTNISPLSGVWFTIYALLLFFIALTLSFKFIQWLLHLNKPLKYDLDVLLKNYPFLSFLSGVLPRFRQRDTPQECREYDTNELSVISTVLERKLVSSWYVPYVSEEIGFPFACKQMLDQMIGRAFQICNKIETKEVYIDICSVLISHLKEYKKAVKRYEKSPSSTIEALYKKSHLIFNNTNFNRNYQAADHCTNILRIVLKELVPWELWDTPHSELLVRILSKKLYHFIDDTLADPVWLNDKLLTILKGNEESETETAPEETPQEKEIQKEVMKEMPKEEVKEIPEEKELPKPETPTIESALSTLITKSTAPILQRAINEDFAAQVPSGNAEYGVDEVGETASEPLDIKTSPLLRQRRGRQGKNEVKIYDRIIEGSVKTWETDVDLQCISLGQDLLASLNGEITLSRLWGQDPAEPDSGKSDQSLWFGEEDALDMDLTDSSPKNRSPVKKEQSPKPADALLKDLQTTVHQAKTKIGDLQVERRIDVPRNSNDEAAGMMEGLLDFGIAGLKKGLRFTGLSDDSQEKSPSHPRERTDEKPSPPPDGNKMKAVLTEAKDSASEFIQKDENGTSSVPHLVKQQRVASQDSLPYQARAAPRELPAALPPLPLTPLADSPEPEYEEAADLSTSIAKLRCLLQQRAEASPDRPEEIWWEGAEETRGRTQRHRSSRPVDAATLADEYDISCERNASAGPTSNNMQRLDRLFQRTVTGVFNSIKTAVGAEGEALPAGAGAGGEGPPPLPRWNYVCTSVEMSTGGAVARLVGSRRAYSRVDAALDTLDQLAPPPQHRDIPPEDFEEWCLSAGGGWCASASLAGAAGAGAQHVVYRMATALFAELAENLISIWLDEATAWLRERIFSTFDELARGDPDVPGARGGPDVAQGRTRRHLDVDETCAAVMDKIPALHVFGEETVSKAVRLSILSFSHREVNKDVIFRVLDLCALHFKNAAGIRNPSFDNN